MTDMKIDVAIAERARAGATLAETELLALESADLLSLGMLADEVRRARVGDLVSYARVAPTHWRTLGRWRRWLRPMRCG